MTDIDKSLDEIIKQRKIGVNKTNVSIPVAKKRVGGAKKFAVAKKPVTGPKKVVVQDARNKLLMKRRSEIKDARETLNKRVNKMVDAREKLSKLKTLSTISGKGVNLPGGRRLSTQFLSLKTAKATSQQLVRTVTNKVRTGVPLNTLWSPSSPGNRLKLAKDDQKQVVLTRDGLTVIKKQTQPIQTPSPMASSSGVFARTVDSLAREAMSNNGLYNQHTVPTSSNKRKLVIVEDEDDEDEGMSYATVGMYGNTKRAKIIQSSINSRPNLSVGLQSRLGAGSDSTVNKGYKVVVSNLHEVVTEQDIIELFGDIGQLMKATLLRPGYAEAIYHKLADAQAAVKNYHNRELDGQPMSCKLVAPPQPAFQRESLSQQICKSGTMHSDMVAVPVKSRVTPDVGVIHKALFHRNAQFPVSPRASITVTM